MQCPTMAGKCACPVLSVLAGHTSAGMKLRALPASHKGSKDRNEYAARRSVVPPPRCRQLCRACEHTLIRHHSVQSGGFYDSREFMDSGMGLKSHCSRSVCRLWAARGGESDEGSDAKTPHPHHLRLRHAR